MRQGGLMWHLKLLVVFRKAATDTSESLSLLSYYVHCERQTAVNSKFIQINAGNTSCSDTLPHRCFIRTIKRVHTSAADK